MTSKLAPLLIVVACNRPDSTSTYFTTRKEFVDALASQCGGHAPDQWITGLRRQELTRITYLCEAFVVGGMNNIAVETVGKSPGPHMKICGLRFGPAVTTTPLESFNFVRKWVDEPAVADRLLRAVGPPARSLDVRKLVDDKYRVHIRMDPTLNSTTTVLIEIDACDRRPDEVFDEIERSDEPPPPPLIPSP